MGDLAANICTLSSPLANTLKGFVLSQTQQIDRGEFLGWTNRRNKRSPLLALGIESLGNRQDADVHKRKKRRCNNELRIELVFTRSNIILLNSLRRQLEKALYYGARMLGVL